MDSAIILLIPFGTTLQAEARSDADDTWLQVTYEGEAGWLIRSLVNARADLDRLPIED